MCVLINCDVVENGHYNRRIHQDLNSRSKIQYTHKSSSPILIILMHRRNASYRLLLYLAYICSVYVLCRILLIYILMYTQVYVCARLIIMSCVSRFHTHLKFKSLTFFQSYLSLIQLDTTNQY